MNPPPLPVPPPAPKSSAVTAGWICVAIGFGTFWIFGLGFAFFSVAMICAVVAMCTHQVQRGIILLLSSFASLAICAVIFFLIISGAMFGAFRRAAHKSAMGKTNQEFILQLQKAQQHQIRFASPTPTP